MQSNHLLVPWNRWKQEKKNSLQEAPARLLAFQCQPHTAVHIVSLILWNMYFVLFSYLFADRANGNCRLPPKWVLTEWGLVHSHQQLHHLARHKLPLGIDHWCGDQSHCQQHGLIAQANLSVTFFQILPLLYRFLAPDRALLLVLISLLLPYFIKHQNFLLHI